MGRVEQLLKGYRGAAKDREETGGELAQEKVTTPAKDEDANLKDFGSFLSQFPLFEPFEELIKAEGLKAVRLELFRNVPEERHIEIAFSWASKNPGFPILAGFIRPSQRGIRNQILIGWSRTFTGRSVVTIAGHGIPETISIGSRSRESFYLDRIAIAMVAAYFNPKAEAIIYGAPNLVLMDKL
jgi:hypothetical protein